MNNIFVRHAKRSGPSGRKIAETLREYLPLHTIGVGRTIDPVAEIIINWGGGYILPNDSVVFNDPWSVRTSSDKIAAFTKLEDNDIQIPYWSFTENWRHGFPQTWEGTGVDIKFPVLARKKHGKRGKGIRYCESYLAAMQYLDTHDFISEFIEKKYEFRVHVAFNEVVKTSQKVFDPTKGKRYQNIIWNHQKGFVFKNPKDDVKPELLERVNNFGIASINAMGLHFGAVDIITDNDEVIWVLETNTAPGLINSTAIAYAKKFAEVINRNNQSTLAEIANNI